MEKPSAKCALLATMLAEDKWGTPIIETDLLSLSPIDGDYPTAREIYDNLRMAPYVTHHGDRGITLDKSNFDALETCSITNVTGKRGRLTVGSNTPRALTTTIGRDEEVF